MFTRSPATSHREAQTGFEPVNQGVADPCLTTWLLRHILFSVRPRTFYQIIRRSSRLNLNFFVSIATIQPAGINRINFIRARLTLIYPGWQNSYKILYAKIII